MSRYEPRIDGRLREKPRRALRDTSEGLECDIEDTWWEEFPQTPRPNRRGNTQAGRLWRSADYELRSNYSTWVLHEWIFAIVCLILDGEEPGSFGASDVVQQVHRSKRREATFQHWRWVNNDWLHGSSQTLRHPVRGEI